MSLPINVCYQSASSADWGGASRVLFTNLKLIDRKAVNPIVLLPAEGPITALLNNLGIDYFIWGQLTEFHNPFEFFSRFIQTVRLFRKAKIQIFHINGANYWRPAEVLAAKVLGIPVVTHFHVNITSHGPWLKLSSAAAAVSEYTAKNSNPVGLPKVVIYNVVEIERFANAKNIRTELGVSEDEVVFLFAGQIREIKGVDLFIKLAHELDDKRARFFIAGECRNTEQINDAYTEKRLLSEFGKNNRIHYLGYRKDIGDIFHSADVIVVPSRWDEPFGLVNIEAGAAGKPVIASAVGGIPEIIESGQNGFLFERGSFSELLDCAKKLVVDSQLRKEMGTRALETVKERFSSAPLRKLVDLYRELASK